MQQMAQVMCVIYNSHLLFTLHPASLSRFIHGLSISYFASRTPTGIWGLKCCLPDVFLHLHLVPKKITYLNITSPLKGFYLWKTIFPQGVCYFSLGGKVTDVIFFLIFFFLSGPERGIKSKRTIILAKTILLV